MIKLICRKCGKTFEFTDHKHAWQEGWDFEKNQCTSKNCVPPETSIIQDFRNSVEDEEE